MVELFNAKYISLHVRETNFAAFHLYRDTLKFTVHGTEAKYYADGENAFDMRKVLTRESFGLPPLPSKSVGGLASTTAAGATAAAAAAAATSKSSKGGKDAALEAEAAATDEAGAAADIEPGKKDIELAAKLQATELD